MEENFNLKPEEELLLHCAIINLDDKTEQRIKVLLNKNINWLYLQEMADRHRLKPLLFWMLRKFPQKCPDNILEEMMENFLNNTQKNLLFIGELYKLIKLLKGESVTAIPYKGPVLAIMVYDNFGLRQFNDLDVYVPLEDIPKTKQILREKGYKILENLEIDQEKVFLKFQREYHFTTAINHITVEIKWKFFSTLFSIKKESFLSDPDAAAEVDLGPFKVNTLSKSILILVLSVHNASHLFLSLHRFFDILNLIISDENIRWSKIIKFAEEMDVKRIFLINMYILRELFKIEIPKKVQLELEKDRKVDEISVQILKRLFSNQNSLSVWEELRLRVGIREKFSNKFKTVINLIFLPTPGVIESVSLHSFFEPLYYILRVLQLIKNINPFK